MIEAVNHPPKGYFQFLKRLDDTDTDLRKWERWFEGRGISTVRVAVGHGLIELYRKGKPSKLTVAQRKPPDWRGDADQIPQA